VIASCDAPSNTSSLLDLQALYSIVPPGIRNNTRGRIAENIRRLNGLIVDSQIPLQIIP